MTDGMIDGMIDAHHHLWDPSRRDYPWMGPSLDRIRKRYGLPELRAAIDGSCVTATVLVQTVSTLDETREFLTTAASSGGLVAGVVGWADLTDPAVAGTLAALREAPGGRLLAGVRHQVEDEPPGWLDRPEVRRGLRAVADAGLVYDLLVRADQLPEARRAAAALPEARFVLDHAAKPPVASGALEPWAGELAALAALPNVTCKLSGLVTEADWTDWDTPAIAPYADRVLDLFGPDRVMFGSDWPVCELAASYAQVVDLARELVPADAADRVFGGTARRVYGLPV
jgi:L-fuconolactonase